MSAIQLATLLGSGTLAGAQSREVGAEAHAMQSCSVPDSIALRGRGRTAVFRCVRSLFSFARHTAQMKMGSILCTNIKRRQDGAEPGRILSVLVVVSDSSAVLCWDQALHLSASASVSPSIKWENTGIPTSQGCCEDPEVIIFFFLYRAFEH